MRAPSSPPAADGQVARWLHQAGLSAFVGAFTALGVREEDFRGLRMQDYEKYGIAAWGDKQKLFHLIQRVNRGAREDPPRPPPPPPLAGPLTAAEQQPSGAASDRGSSLREDSCQPAAVAAVAEQPASAGIFDVHAFDDHEFLAEPHLHEDAFCSSPLQQGEKASSGGGRGSDGLVGSGLLPISISPFGSWQPLGAATSSEQGAAPELPPALSPLQSPLPSPPCAAGSKSLLQHPSARPAAKPMLATAPQTGGPPASPPPQAALAGRSTPLPTTLAGSPSSGSPARHSRDGANASSELAKIKVVVRKRPLNRREAARKEQDVVHVQPDGVSLLVHEPKLKVDLTAFTEEHEFVFDAILDEGASNDEVYRETVEPIVPTIFAKAKATCFAYGQTGSGKTYTMQPLPMRAAEDLLHLAATPEHANNKYELWVSFFEIYGGKLFDLLNDRRKLQVREDGRQQVCVVGLQEHSVGSVGAVQELIERGNGARSTGSTGANEESSRSHAILQLALKRPALQGARQLAVVGKLTFIDLAGSERGADTTDNDRQTRLEGAEINKSLLALKECIRALDHEQGHIPFRGSKLTEVLRDSFVGNSRTVMVSCISPGTASVEHTLNTLRYTDRVKGLSRNSNQRPNAPPSAASATAAHNLPLASRSGHALADDRWEGVTVTASEDRQQGRKPGAPQRRSGQAPLPPLPRKGLVFTEERLDACQEAAVSTPLQETAGAVAVQQQVIRANSNGSRKQQQQQPAIVAATSDAWAPCESLAKLYPRQEPGETPSAASGRRDGGGDPSCGSFQQGAQPAGGPSWWPSSKPSSTGFHSPAGPGDGASGQQREADGRRKWGHGQWLPVVLEKDALIAAHQRLIKDTMDVVREYVEDLSDKLAKRIYSARALERQVVAMKVRVVDGFVESVTQED
eukprot:SM000005S17309  [mRNA]  locus=s5:1311716:1316621:- [translate_table: standard]